MSSEQKSLEWLDYDSPSIKSAKVKISSIEEQAEFTRRDNMILPSNDSVKLHCLRGTYIMRLAVNNDLISSYDITKHGWLQIGDRVYIIWDENIEEEEKG